MTALLLTSIQTGNTSCANLSHKDLELLSGGKENISFFCSHCLPNVSDALALYQTYYKSFVKSRCQCTPVVRGEMDHVTVVLENNRCGSLRLTGRYCCITICLIYCKKPLITSLFFMRSKGYRGHGEAYLQLWRSYRAPKL